MKKQPLTTETPLISPSRSLIALGMEIDEVEVIVPVPASSKKVARIARGEATKGNEAMGPEYSVDKRGVARRIHTNHFTSRAPADSK